MNPNTPARLHSTAPIKAPVVGTLPVNPPINPLGLETGGGTGGGTVGGVAFVANPLDVVGGQDTVGTNADGDATIQRVQFLRNGTTITSYFETDGETPMTNSTAFTTSRPVRAALPTELAAITNLDVTDPLFGQVINLNRRRYSTDGVLDDALTEYGDADDATPTAAEIVATTLLVTTGAPWDFAQEGQRVHMGSSLLAVPAATVVTLADGQDLTHPDGVLADPTAIPPLLAGHVRIHVEDANVRYTIDGSDPTDNDGVRVPDGGNIVAEKDNISRLRFIAMDGGAANLTVEYHNMNIDED